MQSAIKPIVRALVFYTLSVLVIAAVLVAGTFVVGSIKDFHISREDVKALGNLQAELGEYRQAAAAKSAEKLKDAQDLPLAMLDRRIGQLAQELRSSLPPADIDLPALLRMGPQQYAGKMAVHFKAQLARELAAQELAYLQQVRAQILALRKDAEARLARLHREHVAAYQRYLQKRRQLDEVGPLARQLMKYPWAMTPPLKQLDRDIARLRTENERAAAAYRAQRSALDRTSLARGVRPYAVDQAALDLALQPLDALLAQVRSAVSAHPLSRFAALLLPALPVAFAILLACLAGRFAVRAVLYFVLAPLVTGRAPLRLDAAAPGRRTESPGGAAQAVSSSAVSQTIRLDPNEELLVLPRYLQSTPVAAERTTRWLLQGRPWTSLVSGMALLTCVRTRSRDEGVVLSAVGGDLGQLALIRVPAGSALVFQPRALVGVVCDRNAPLQLERHWRLTSLHAWLTLQLRYFLIRGPATLVLQGRRGVRVGQADGDHLVRQSATLGFSADVAYSTLRSTPFLPYLQGQTDLLYDRFSGGQGIYVHDETPATGRAGGRIKRGLEGLSDGVLKVFGL